MSAEWAVAGDLPRLVLPLAVAVAAASLILLAWELRRARQRGRGRRAWPVALSGAISLGALLLAVLRPVRVDVRGTMHGPRVVVLLDASRSMDLPADEPGASRRDIAGRLTGPIADHLRQVRVDWWTFGLGAPRPFAAGAPRGGSGREVFSTPGELGSDLVAALEAVGAAGEERPGAVIVVSDGRLDRPTAERVEAEVRAATLGLAVPVHTVSVATEELADAAVADVLVPAALVAHQPAPITVKVACTGGLECGTVPVVARELRLDGPPVVLGSGTARPTDGTASVTFDVVVDQAGRRIVEVAIESPDGDRVPENDRRLVGIDVVRDRVRLLHIAGRPTYDVRALRSWLKSDVSLDVVAFFILRTMSEPTFAPNDELSLIEFPVNELFTVHLPSFDAIILQDFDARAYDLLPHLRSLARYVRGGGGLIMVGGESSFVGGNYARSPLAEVLPVELDGIERDRAVDHGRFVPRTTEAGRVAPVLRPLRVLLGDDLAEMAGVNVVGGARENGTVLWEHPWLRTREGAPMPVLALGEYGNGRTVALTVDGSHELLFSPFAARTAGRAHGALWDALLGWLMRDPRFEPAMGELPAGCVAGASTTLVVHPLLSPTESDVTRTGHLELAQLGTGERVRDIEIALGGGRDAVPVDLGVLPVGGYAATLRLAEPGASAPTRLEFACEAGGVEWADTRPDPARLRRIAEASGGRAVGPDEVTSIPVPEPSTVVTERSVRPVWPPWRWSLLAALCLGLHWLQRRSTGLS